jgi:hypothetical protein
MSDVLEICTVRTGIDICGNSYYLYGMKTITIKVPVSLEIQLQEASRARRVSKSRLVRDILTRALRNESRSQRPSALAMMKDGLGVVKSGKRDLASNKQHLEGFGK